MIDPITVSVVQHRLGAIVEEMGEAMLHTSYSQILNSSRDLSTGDGWPAGGEWQAASGIKLGSVEVAEVCFPLFFRRHELRPGSGGDGRYRGGRGGVRSIWCSRPRGRRLAMRIGETTYRSALSEGYRYGDKWVGDRTEGRHFAVIEMHLGACKGGASARTKARKV